MLVKYPPYLNFNPNYLNRVGSLGPLTSLVVVNGIYIKGFWASPFEPYRTRKTDFYLDGAREVKVDMMTQTGDFDVADLPEVDATVVNIPYKVKK